MDKIVDFEYKGVEIRFLLSTPRLKRVMELLDELIEWPEVNLKYFACYKSGHIAVIDKGQFIEYHTELNDIGDCFFSFEEALSWIDNDGERV